MGSFSIWHWLVVLVIVMLVFGTKKLPSIGKDVGNAIKGFREGMKEANAEQTLQNQQNPQNQQTLLNENQTKKIALQKNGKMLMQKLLTKAQRFVLHATDRYQTMKSNS